MGVRDWMRRHWAGTRPASTPRPVKSQANPGVGHEGDVGFSNAERSWTETFHVVHTAACVLRELGHDVVDHDTWLQLPVSGLVVQPLMVSLQPLEEGGVRTVTTIEVSHPELGPRGMFEYQHATGDNTEEAISNGVKDWGQLDLVVFLDALRAKPEVCSALDMAFPEKDGRPPRRRRALLGPVAHYVQDPPEGGEGEICNAESGEHSFCNCCLLTQNFDAFRQHIEGEGTFGIRFYAARDGEGNAQADCRINGVDYEPGMESLRAYVATWSGNGLESRKQYVLVRSVSGEGAA